MNGGWSGDTRIGNVQAHRGLLVCAPLWVEARALRPAMRRALPTGTVLRTGYRQRSGREGPRAAAAFASAVAVAGVAGSTRAEIRPGDVVVATEVKGSGTGTCPVPCPTAPLLANALRRQGCRVHTGPVRTVERIRSGARSRVAAGVGVLAVDLESAPLAAAAGGLPIAVARVVVDSPDRPLFRLDLPARGLTALARLPAVGRGLAEWATAVGEREVLLTTPLPGRPGTQPEADGVGHAPREVAARTDLVLVLGSRNSRPAQRVVALARQAGTPAYLIGDLHDVQANWLADAGMIAVNVIASAPTQLVDGFLAILGGMGRCRIREQATPAGHACLPLPEDPRP